MANSNTGRRRNPFPWLLLSLRGRISRQIYWLTCGYLISANTVVASQIVGGEEASFFNVAVSVWPFVALGTVYCQVAISVKRLHDIGYSGFLGLASLVPFINIFFTVWVGLPPGTSGPNPYGDAPDRPPAG